METKDKHILSVRKSSRSSVVINRYCCQKKIVRREGGDKREAGTGT